MFSVLNDLLPVLDSIEFLVKCAQASFDRRADLCGIKNALTGVRQRGKDAYLGFVVYDTRL